jgi:hypoxanthine phosphoribosyltransferase/broad specificity phosphatase PhoE
MEQANMKSYDYAQRKGVRYISWDEFAALSAQLAERLEPYKPEVIVGIARAGLLPATAVASSLRRELLPVRLTRRKDDIVVYDGPVWKVPLSTEVAGKVVAVIDEIADSGETLRMVVAEAIMLGASQVISASLVTHTWADPQPQISALVSDELIIFPWDRRVLTDGQWETHPELLNAMVAQYGASDAHPSQPSLRMLEVRRHSMRAIPEQHLSQAGVDLARRVGESSGPFARVITSEVPRAFETAIAMGFAVDEQNEILNQLTPGVEDEVAWDAGFAAFALAAQLAGETARYSQAMADFWRTTLEETPNGDSVLMVTHGGIVEAGAVACLPQADHVAWGPYCDYCEGVRLYFDGQRFTNIQILRT